MTLTWHENGLVSFSNGTGFEPERQQHSPSPQVPIRLQIDGSTALMPIFTCMVRSPTMNPTRKTLGYGHGYIVDWSLNSCVSFIAVAITLETSGWSHPSRRWAAKVATRCPKGSQVGGCRRQVYYGGRTLLGPEVLSQEMAAGRTKMRK